MEPVTSLMNSEFSIFASPVLYTFTTPQSYVLAFSVKLHPSIARLELPKVTIVAAAAVFSSKLDSVIVIEALSETHIAPPQALASFPTKSEFETDKEPSSEKKYTAPPFTAELSTKVQLSTKVSEATPGKLTAPPRLAELPMKVESMISA